MAYLSGARIVLCGACRRCIQSRQILGAKEFVKDSKEIEDKLNALKGNLQLCLTVRSLGAGLHYLSGYK